MGNRSLLKEIDSVFPPAEMPAKVTRQAPRFIESSEIDVEIEEFRGLPMSVGVIRAIHRYLPVLSVDALQWLFPHYLHFCLSAEGMLYSRKEAASLLYFLGPSHEFVEDTIMILSSLTNEQRMCLIHFLEWCRDDNYWADILECIDNGIKLLSVIGNSVPNYARTEPHQ
jgi:hypothetical protein